jgi:serine/threonine protein phosphatase PrpC
MVMVMNAIVVSDGDLKNTFEGRDHEELNLGSVAGVTDRGIRHERNEDALALAAVQSPAGPAVVVIVSDGVSSADRPDEASLEAARAAVHELAEAAEAGADLGAASEQAITSARDAVIALAEDAGEAPAATYISAVVTTDLVTLCWMGDSRAYWLFAEPEPAAQQLTRDDSLAEEMVAQGMLAEADALESPQAHVVTRWIGPGARDAEPHIAQFTPPGPGVLLLCSDGLWNYDPDGGKMATLAMPTALHNPRAAAMALLLYALEAGGVDNITVAVVPYPLGVPAAEPGSAPQESEPQGDETQRNETQRNETQRNEPVEDEGAGNEPGDPS